MSDTVLGPVAQYGGSGGLAMALAYYVWRDLRSNKHTTPPGSAAATAPPATTGSVDLLRAELEELKGMVVKQGAQLRTSYMWGSRMYALLEQSDPDAARRLGPPPSID